MKKIAFPHPLIILIACILVAGILTWVIPAGQYKRTRDNPAGREMVIPGSYGRVAPAPSGITAVLMAVPRGFEAGADVIVCILLFGGTFCVVDRTGAFKAGLLWLISKSGRFPITVLWLVGLAFAAGGAMDNTSEEIIALIPVVVFMAGRLGYSKIGAVAISTGCAVIGASFSPMNPFQVGIAQKIAEVPLLSGALLRIVFLVPAVLFWISWVVKRTKAVPFASPGVSHAMQGAVAASLSNTSPASLSSSSADSAPVQLEAQVPTAGRLRLGIILLLVLLSFAIMVYGIIRMDWDFDQMTALFFALGIVAGLVGKMGLNGTASAFTDGVREMTTAALIVGLARSVYLVLQDGRVIDTIVHGLFTPLQHLPLVISAIGMTLAHVLIHIPVSSTSGQAQLTIPLLTPLADLTGMSRQVMIMAYQYGAGLSELFSPTNGALMGVLAVAGISYKDWWAFVWKPALYVFGIGAIAMMIGIAIGY